MGLHWRFPMKRIYFLISIPLIITLQVTVADIPDCPFEDTTNITGSEKYLNGSYLYENLLIPPHLIADYDYEILHNNERLEVPTHTRGCICKLKPCVKFCCHPNDLVNTASRECRRPNDELDGILDYELNIKVTLKDGKTKDMHVLNEFAVQKGIPCHHGYMLSPQDDELADWALFENGTLLRKYDNALISKRDYCLAPHKINDTYFLNPLNCPEKYEQPFAEKLNTYTMIVSIPFLILTILVYSCIPELRNLHGKCLISHLSALTIGYAILGFYTISGRQFSTGLCSFMGYSTYYFFMAAFFWLSVISYDLWRYFYGNKNKTQKNTDLSIFRIYSLYAWGLPIPFTILTIIAQLSNLNDNLKPGIGELYCWVTPEGWAAMIYFYGPVLILILYNIVMFFLVARKLYQIRKDTRRLAATNEVSKNKFRSQKGLFLLFLRLFLIMGVTWLLEIISYMVGTESAWSKIFILSDFCNAAQGIIIFIVFVLLRKKVRQLVKERCFCGEKKLIEATSANSDCPPEEISLQPNDTIGI